MNRNYYLPHFTYAELACKESGKVLLAVGFGNKLTELRTKFVKPMVVTSCCRSWSYNQKIGGAKNSFHIYDKPSHKGGGCCAIDIALTNSHQRGRIISLALGLGWSIGIHKTFVHLDRSSDYTSLLQVLFTY